MTPCLTRVCRLYNIKERPAQPASKKRPAVSFRPAQKGIFDAGKTWVFESLLLRDPDDPFIPGTPVPRRPPSPLGEKAEGVLDSEIARVITELQRFRQAQLAAKQRNAERAGPASAQPQHDNEAGA